MGTSLEYIQGNIIVAKSNLKKPTGLMGKLAGISTQNKEASGARPEGINKKRGFQN